MTEKIRTRIRLNSKEPELIGAHVFLQKKQKIKAANPSNSLTDQIFRMHTILGNEAVQRLIASGAIQAKLRMGQPNDKYEQEADRAADRIMEMSESQKSLVNSYWSLGDKGSEHTRDRDRRKVSRSTGSFVQTQTIPRGEEEPITKEEEEDEKQEQEEQEPVEEIKEEPLQTKPLIQRRRQEEEEGEAEPVPEGMESHLAANRGSGSPLQIETRLNMETRFNADFSEVRVHNDPDAHQMNRDINARAFTHQNHIYFGAGYYNPHTYEGQRLLAHELAHVLQQGAAVRKKVLVTQSSPEVIQRTNGAGSSWGSVSGLLGNLTSIISGGFQAGRRFFRDFLRRIPGYSLLGVVMGQDPLTGEGIARNGRNFIEAGLDVIPFGHDFKRKLEREGAMDEAAAWLDQEIEQLDFDPHRIANQFRRFWDSLNILSLGDLDAVIQRLRNIFEPLIARLFSFARNVAERLLEIVKDYLIQQVIEFIRERTRAYPLLTVILERDPISDERVERTPMNLIRGFMELSEDGAEQLRQMEDTGSLERAANWVSRSIARLSRNLQNIRSGFSRIWQRVSISSLMDPMGTFREIYDTFSGPVGDIFSFLIEVAGMVLRYIKDALLSGLSNYARTVRGYPLLTVILGRDPFTGETVPRTATNFVRGFLSLLEDGEERFRNLQESGALDRAFTWLGNEVRRLNLTWPQIVALFRTTWNELSLRDLANPGAAFQRIVNRFRAPVGRIIRFAAAVGMKILEFVFEGVMGAGGTRVLNILKRARDTFLTIIRDPVTFLGHLIDAVVLGFRQFSQHILQHLQTGLVGWLFGTLEGAGLELPERWDLRGFISLGLQILGLTYARIRPRLVRLMGEPVVLRLESAFEFLRLLVTEGPAAAWQKIVEYAGNLRDQVMEGIKEYVINRIVQTAVVQIASMFSPVGAVVQSIITTYNVIMFFIERIQQILAVVESVTNSIANIAAGNIAAAANYVEQTMARTLPVIISFLARLLRLGNISGAIRRIIQRIRRPVDRAIDRIVNWIARQGRRLRRGVRAVGRRIRRGARRVAGWLGFREQFTTRQGESHSLYISGTRQSPRLMVSSDTPTDYQGFLDRAQQTISNSSGGRDNAAVLRIYREARTKYNEISRDMRRARQSDAPDAVNNDKLRALRIKTKELMEHIMTEGVTDLPPSVIRYSGSSPGGYFGKNMEANPLTITGDPGSEPSSSLSNESWNILKQRKESSPTGRTLYIRGHLLNHNIHGPGNTWDNLTPITQTANRRHESEVERHVKDAVEDGKVVFYKVEAQYGRGVNNALINRIRTSNEPSEVKNKKIEIVEKENTIPFGLTCHAYELNPETRQRQRTIISGLSIANQIRNSSPDDYIIESNGAAPVVMVRLKHNYIDEIDNVSYVGRPLIDSVINLLANGAERPKSELIGIAGLGERKYNRLLSKVIEEIP